MDVITVETKSLGDRSYLVHDGSAALVIDPQRDCDRFEEAAAAADVHVTHVAETHLHNDYLSGGLVLAERAGASYVVNVGDQVGFERTGVRGGDQFDVGDMTVEVVATPGHSRTHLSYVVCDGAQQAVFSGGSLLYGSVGRTDLVADTATDELARAQYESVRKLAAMVNDDAGLYPTHGFGSFCSSGPSVVADVMTIGEQRVHNLVFTDLDVDHFVRELVGGYTAYPSYYAHMSPRNAQGPGPATLTPPESLNGAEISRRLRTGQWVIDLRSRVAFAPNHLDGAVNFEYGDSFTTYLGWVIPWGEHVSLVGDKAAIEGAVRDLTRIGIDPVDVAVGGGPIDIAPQWPTRAYPRVGWTQVAVEKLEFDLVLDVRRADEYAAEHIVDAMNIPLHELGDRLDELPEDRLWIHCASGYRAGIGASLLQRAGLDVVHVDANFADAAPAGMPVEPEG